VQRYPDDTRRAPAKPPAQPVGMAESDMNKSSWQKPARTEPARGSCGVRSRLQMKSPPGREPAGLIAIGNAQAAGTAPTPVAMSIIDLASWLGP